MKKYFFPILIGFLIVSLCFAVAVRLNRDRMSKSAKQNQEYLERYKEGQRKLQVEFEKTYQIKKKKKS